jgi:hypothetical protein
MMLLFRTAESQIDWLVALFLLQNALEYVISSNDNWSWRRQLGRAVER